MTLYRHAARLAKTLPSHKIASVARELMSVPVGKITKARLAAAWGSIVVRPDVSSFCEAALESDLSGGEIGSALLAASEAMSLARDENRVDLIWTGPQTTAIPVRRSEQSLCELIDSAKSELFIVSFVAFKTACVDSSIANAIARGVRVSFLGESSKEYGGTLEKDHVKMFHDRFPDVTCYRWVVTGEGEKRCVHAKCAVADGEAALVTSANLTNAAMDSNMELGVLIRNMEVCGKLILHFRALVDEHIIKEI